MSIQEGKISESGQEKSETETLEENIFRLRDQIVIAHLSTGGKLSIPITQESLDSEIIVAETNELYSTDPVARENDDDKLVIFGSGEWGSRAGYLSYENIDSILQKYALVTDPEFQELDAWYFSSLDEITPGSYDEYKKLEDDLDSEFDKKVKLYMVDNRLNLMRGLQDALIQTLIRLQNPQ